MAVTINIDGTDRTNKVQWRSLKITNALTSQQDVCQFDILWESVNHTYKPTIGEIVEVIDGSTTVFKGPIVAIEDNPTNYRSSLLRIDCRDYGRLLDRKLVVNIYENQTVNAIVADIISTYTSGFTTNNVNSSLTIDYIAFNYETVSEALAQIAEVGSLDWYVDSDQDIHMFAKEENSAPTAVEDDNGVIYAQSLVVRDDNSQVRNQIYVRGSEYEGTKFTAEMESDGIRHIYELPYRYKEFACTLTGQPLSIGIDYIDEADDYDALYNFQEKIIRWKEADKPSSGATIRYSGKPMLPVIVKVSDREAQSVMASDEGYGDGVYEHVIIDKSIKSKEGARQRANAEIVRYKTTMSEGEFKTTTSGFRAGQRVQVNSVSRGVNKYYMINKVKYQMRGPNEMIYDVSLISTKSFGILEWMAKQLRDEKKKIAISEDEVLDVIETANAEITITESIQIGSAQTFDETINVGESVTVQAIDYALETVLAPYGAPSGTKRVFILGSPLN
jgi:hypothetical protein